MLKHSHLFQTFFLAFVLISSGIIAQPTADPPTIVPPTPNAMKITEYQAQRPNLYTGTASLNIPLYTIDFDGWGLPISLSYSATGVRTNEEASEVGLGWSLSATGMVSRTVRGVDDLFEGGLDGKKGFIHTALPVSHEKGYNWQTDISPPIGSYYNHLVTAKPDTEPDIFNYNFFTYSGSFVLLQKQSDGEGGWNVPVRKITQDGCMIEFNLTAKTFKVITPEGFIGEFTVKERSTSFSGSTVTNNPMVCCGENLIDITYYENSSGVFRTITSWYLSKIISPNGYTIDFSYDLDSNGQSQRISNSIAFSESPDITSQYVCLQTVQEHVYLESILLKNPSQESLLKVDFSMEGRHDLRKNTLFTGPGARFPVSDSLMRFKSIHVVGMDENLNLTKTIKSIEFFQSYFNPHKYDPNGMDPDEPRWLRGRLHRVKIDDQEYQFYYESGSAGLPDKLTNGIDHFGFFNGENTNFMVLPPVEENNGAFYGDRPIGDSTISQKYKQRWERRVDFSYSKAGLLKKVKYPTRGYTVFEFEQHAYVPANLYFTESGSNSPAGGARIKSIKEYDENNILRRSKTYTYTFNADGTGGSTGKLMTPLYNRYYQVLRNSNPPHEITGVRFHYKTFSSIPGNSSAEGKIVGYSKVHEVVEGDGQTYKSTLLFENRPNKVLFGNSLAAGFPNLNGQIKEVREFNADNKIVQLIQNQDYYHPLDSIKALAYEPGNQTYLWYFVPYYVRLSHNTPYTIVTTTPAAPSQVTENSSGEIVLAGSYLSTEKEFTFNTDYQVKTELTTDSEGNEIRVEFKRPRDYTTPASIISSMIGNNMLSPIIEYITRKNGTVISAVGNKYDLVGSLVKVKSTYVFNPDLGAFLGSSNGNLFGSPYEERLTYSSYDTGNGKLLEYKGSDGVPNAFIWGYKGLLPVVHGVGVSYNDLLQAHTNAIPGSSNYELNLRNNPLLSSKQIKTYSYHPNIGIKQAHDLAGQSKTFHYDQYNRLASVVDDQDIVAQNQYHLIERSLTRIISVEGNLNFGTIYECTAATPRTITVTNTGEYDLSISGYLLPSGYSIEPWYIGKIPPETSVELTVSFSGTGTGTYNGTLEIFSDKTSGIGSVEVAATKYASGSSKVISISPNPVAASDFQYLTQNIKVKNTGEGCLTITGISHAQTSDWFISMSTPITLVPGQSAYLQVMRLSSTTPENIDVTINSDKTSGNNIVQLRPATRIMGLSPSTLSFTGFTEVSKNLTTTISNSGYSPLVVTGYTATNTRFSVTPSSFTVDPGAQQNVTITYSSTDFTNQNGTITFESNKTSGNNILTVSGQRTQLYQLSASPTSLSIKPSTPVGTSYVTNTGNVNATISSVSNSNATHFNIQYFRYSGGIWVPVSFPYTISPGQQIMIEVRTTGNYNSATGILTIQNSQGGSNVINLSKSSF